MKKIIFRLCFCVAILCTGFSVSSCDESSPWLDFIKNLIGTNATYTYSGDASYECLEGTYSPMSYTSIGEFTVSSQQVTLTTTANDSQATLVLPAVTSGDITLTAVTLSALDMTNETNATKLSVGENSYIDGKITYKGKSYDASNLYIANASATSGVVTLEMTIYYGDEMTEAVNYRYSGKVVSQP
ncbi:MAG: hypothetical protein ACI4B5_07475 [Bacteroidaceae bacterium]